MMGLWVMSSNLSRNCSTYFTTILEFGKWLVWQPYWELYT